MRTLSSIATAIEPLRHELLTHPLYRAMNNLSDLQVFMAYHGFAVFDFMSLLKALQRRLTCVTVPWVPVGSPEVRLLINQIVQGEESDRAADGRVLSHYELYLEAMDEAGADTQPLRNFVASVACGKPLAVAFEENHVPQCVRDFVNHTFSVIETGGTHAVAAAFTYGREDLIPAMFTELVNRLYAQDPARVNTLRYYLERHIQLDGDEHGDLGRAMVRELCGEDPQRWAEAEGAAVEALRARIRLWDGIYETLAEGASVETARLGSSTAS